MADNNVLISKLKEGDKGALEELVRSNMGLVRSVALRFRDRGSEYEDLVQIGSIGLLRAARSFDFSYGCMFSTYAVPLIIGEIRRFLRDDGMIKISRTLKSKGALAMREREKFLNTYTREPTVNELADACRMEKEELVLALEAASPVHSLSEAVGEDQNASLENFIADNENPLDTLTDNIALHEALAKLSPFQQKIVDLRYFKELSQQKTGQILGITQVKVSREEKKIMQTLRSELDCRFCDNQQK